MNTIQLCPACNGRTSDGRGVGIIVIKNGLVAVSRRLDHSNALQFPGGHVERKEPCINGIVRELREETGLTVDARRIEHLFHNVDAVGYSGQAYDAEELRNPEPHKHSDWNWWPVGQLTGVKMIPSTERGLAFAKTNFPHLLHL